MTFRPRFSVRALTMFVTLACVSFGAWEATKAAAAKGRCWYIRLDDANFKQVLKSSALMPCILYQEERHVSINRDARYGEPDFPLVTRPARYYLWLFGPTIKLPFESEWSDGVSVLVPSARSRSS